MNQNHAPTPKPLGEGPLWHAGEEELALRWIEQASDNSEVRDLEPAKVVRRLDRRARAILRFAHIAPPQPHDTHRRWDTGWRPRDAWNQLATTLHEHNWQVTLLTAPVASHTAASLHGPDKDVVLIDKDTAAQLAERFQAAGLLLPFTWEDAATMLLAEEVFAVLAESAGNRPSAPWVDEKARYRFARLALGWPFSPWVREFLS